MVHLLTQLAKYFMIVLILIYTLESFLALRYTKRDSQPKAIYRTQKTILFTLHFVAFAVLFLTTMDVQLIVFYLMQVALFIAIFVLYAVLYKNASTQLLNNMCMLMCIGLIILTRLNSTKAFRQFIFMLAGLVLVLLFPAILRGTSQFFRRLTWAYAVIGLLALLVVCVAGSTSYGAKLSLTIGSISIQPSEFVKILFVFFLASILYRAETLRDYVIASAVAAAHVLVLVASKDLGGALLFFFVYLVMIYMAVQRIAVFGLGLVVLCGAACAGYLLFSHVQTRVIAWLDPLSVIDNEGYQISQSLFAIGTGGWFGLGLNEGLPSKIPVVEKDFVFSAISEEMGGIFALCVLMICISCFLIIFNISMQLKDRFYRLVAMGLGTAYAFQVFLTVGGVIKFIPSTGVTLPLVSYGGSSLLATMILFGVVQALYLMQSDEQKQEVKEVEERQKLEDAIVHFTESEEYLYTNSYADTGNQVRQQVQKSDRKPVKTNRYGDGDSKRKSSVKK